MSLLRRFKRGFRRAILTDGDVRARGTWDDIRSDISDIRYHIYRRIHEPISRIRVQARHGGSSGEGFREDIRTIVASFNIRHRHNRIFGVYQDQGHREIVALGDFRGDIRSILAIVDIRHLIDYRILFFSRIMLGFSFHPNDVIHSYLSLLGIFELELRIIKLELRIIKLEFHIFKLVLHGVISGLREVIYPPEVNVPTLSSYANLAVQALTIHIPEFSQEYRWIKIKPYASDDEIHQCEELICPVNLELMEDPIELLPCKHTIESSIIPQLRSFGLFRCPLGRAPILETRPNESIKTRTTIFLNTLENQYTHHITFNKLGKSHTLEFPISTAEDTDTNDSDSPSAYLDLSPPSL